MAMSDEERRAKKAALARAWRERNPDKVAAQQRRNYERKREVRLAYAARPDVRAAKAERMRKWREDNRELSRLQFRAWNYGLTIGQVRSLLEAGCDVCGSLENLHVDHDHACCPEGASPRSCGKCVRGALCHSCNTAKGLLKENPDRVRALLAHLERRVT